MPYYYAYHVDAGGHVLSRTDIYAETDEQAVEKAKERLNGQGVEVWCLDRKVCALKRPD
jgi:hypothetical protein